MVATGGQFSREWQRVPSSMQVQEITARRIPLLDLPAQFQPIREEVLAEILRVVDSQRFILGDDVRELEHDIAAYCGTAHAVGCASGSDALLLALLALGVGPGDEVLTTPYTFFATAGAIHHAGATPVFVDVDADTFNIDVSQATDAMARRPKLRAILPVHLFGGCVDMDPLLEAAAARGIPVIEDAAQAIGAEYKSRRAGSMGATGCFSFFPSKNLGGFGDGGIVTTNDEDLAERLRALRVHGSRRKYHHQWVGLNSRLDTLQAAVLRVKLRYLDEWSVGRQRNAELYRQQLAGTAVRVPAPAAYQTKHIYNQFVICTERRGELQRTLTEQGIGTEVYYPIPLHLQPCFAHLGYAPGDFPVAERLAAESLALPIQAELAADDLAYICEVIRRSAR